VRGILKKITSIILIFLFIFDSCGYFFVYYELSNYFKQDAFSKINDFIPDNELVILTFHKSNIAKANSQLQILNNSEIKFNGMLYDICKTVSKDDSVFYYCINDKNESILEEAFSNYLNSKTQESSKNIPIHNILQNIIKIAIVPIFINNTCFQSSIKFITNFINLLPQYSIDIPTPPPKHFS
jgi:hypothetical protein